MPRVPNHPVVDAFVKKFIFVACLDKVFDDEISLDQSQDQGGHLREQVNKEYVVVPDTDAIVDPGAVVIVPVDARVADDAVTRSICSDGSALWAKG